MANYPIMLYYHENENDETLLDNEPLLQFHNRSQLEQRSKLSSSSSRIVSKNNNISNASLLTSPPTNVSQRLPFNVSSLFDETDCLVDLSPPTGLLATTTTTTNTEFTTENYQTKMEDHVYNDSDNSSDYDNNTKMRLDENANIRYSIDHSSYGNICGSTDVVPIEGQDSLINFDPNADIAENLLAIFVVSFDAKLGNVIEWQMPHDLDLKHIEFKAMASGFHLISNDLVYVFFFCKSKVELNKYLFFIFLFLKILL